MRLFKGEKDGPILSFFRFIGTSDETAISCSAIMFMLFTLITMRPAGLITSKMLFYVLTRFDQRRKHQNRLSHKDIVTIRVVLIDPPSDPALIPVKSGP